MHCHRDAHTGLVRMLGIVVAASRVVQNEPSPLECPDHLGRREGWESRAHAAGTTTLNSTVYKPESKFRLLMKPGAAGRNVRSEQLFLHP